jgi:uncharacterized protein YbjT (DUF2867 family)
MSTLTVLAVGATGSIGRQVVAEALAAGHRVRALVRNRERARELPAEAEIVIGDVTAPHTLAAAVEGIDAVVFTLGSDGQGKVGARTIDYEGVRNVLGAIGHREVTVALMTSIGVTNRDSSYNRTSQAHDWKRRSERLLRASGQEYTIVRPGWFDYNEPSQLRIVMLQGDRRQSGSPADGVIARRQIAQVLVASLSSDAAKHRTLELVAETGAATVDVDPLFAALSADPPGSLDGVGDLNNMALDQEPAEVRTDLTAIS